MAVTLRSKYKFICTIRCTSKYTLHLIKTTTKAVKAAAAAAQGAPAVVASTTTSTSESYNHKIKRRMKKELRTLNRVSACGYYVIFHVVLDNGDWFNKCYSVCVSLWMRERAICSLFLHYLNFDACSTLSVFDIFLQTVYSTRFVYSCRDA